MKDGLRRLFGASLRDKYLNTQAIRACGRLLIKDYGLVERSDGHRMNPAEAKAPGNIWPTRTSHLERDVAPGICYWANNNNNIYTHYFSQF